MAQNCQNRQKTDVSVLIPASHNPRVRQIVIFMRHTYRGYSQLCIITAHAQAPYR